MVTKSGGNAYHGALFEFVRNDVFDAIPYAFTSVMVGVVSGDGRVLFT